MTTPNGLDFDGVVPPLPKWRSIGRTSWKSAPVLATGDQLVSSLGNFAFVIAIAHATSAREFGQLSLAYLTLQLGLGLIRATLAEPYLVARASTGDVAALDSGFWRIWGSWTLLAAAAAALAVVLLSGSSALLIMAAAFLPVGLQDAARYVAFGRRRPAAALASDSIWTGGFLATVAALAVAGRISAPAIVAAWALTALASLVPIWRSLSLSHRADRSTFSWRDSTGRMSATFGAEYVLLKASGQAVAYTLPWFASVEAAGGYRAASSLTNIITVLFAAVPFVLMPSLRRRITDGAIGRAEVLAWTSRVCAVLLAVTTVLGACLLLLPDQQGRFVLGDSWTDTRPVLLPMLLATASIAVWTGLLMAMRALADLRGSLTARIIQSVFVVLCSIGGAALSGARGAAFGFALGNWLGLIGWIRALRRSTGIAPDTDEGSPAAWMGQAGDP